MQDTRYRPELVQKTQELLRNRPRHLTLEQIARETGLPKRWLEAVSAKEISLETVNRVEILYNNLSGNKLFNEL